MQILVQWIHRAKWSHRSGHWDLVCHLERLLSVALTCNQVLLPKEPTMGWGGEKRKSFCRLFMLQSHNGHYTNKATFCQVRPSVHIGQDYLVWQTVACQVSDRGISKTYCQGCWACTQCPLWTFLDHKLLQFYYQRFFALYNAQHTH